MKKFYAVLMICAIAFASCKKADDENNGKPEPKVKITVEVTTGDASNLAETSAVLAGSYAITEGETTVSKVGFFIGSDSGVGENNTAIEAAAVAEQFTANATNLEEGVTYYYKAFAKYTGADGKEAVAMGAEKQFTTPSLYVKFKDQAFEEFCLSYYDMDEDGKLSYEEAAEATGHVNFANRGFTDMTGIRAFKNVTEIELWNNAFSTLDMSGMDKLEKVWIQNNANLKNFNFQGCVKLEYVEAHTSGLEVVNLADLPGLKTVYIQANPSLASADFSNSGVIAIYSGGNAALTSVNVTGCNALYHLEMWGCGLTDLDISNLPALTNVYVQQNKALGKLNAKGSAVVHLEAWQDALYSVDCSDCSRLFELFVQDQVDVATGSITVQNCPELVNLQMGNAKYTSIDVSTCPKIANLVAGNNALQAVNINGCHALAAAHFYGNNTLQSVVVTDAPALTDMNLNDCSLATLDVSGASMNMNLLWAQNNVPLKKITLKTGQNITDFRYDTANVELEYK